MLKFFLTAELLRWPQFSERYSPLLMAQVNFFQGEQGAKTWDDLQKRVTEHVRPAVCVFWLGEWL